MTKNGKQTYGETLKRLRRAAGLTQVELAQKVGVSQGDITYYEARSKFPPPAHLIPSIAGALHVSADQLLGIKPVADEDEKHPKLWRRFRELQRLSKREQQIVLAMIESFVKERVGSPSEQLAQRRGATSPQA